MRRIRIALVAIAVLGLFAAIMPASPAGATVTCVGSSCGLLADDWQNNTPNFNALTGENLNTNGNCDTIDIKGTWSNDIVSYKCVAPLDIRTWGLETFDKYSSTNRPDLDVGIRDAFRGTMTLKQRLPANVSEIRALGVDRFGANYFWVFANDNNQQARQVIGPTSDCTRYAHNGPYFTDGPVYRYFFSYQITIAPNLTTTDPEDVTVTEKVGSGRYDGAYSFFFAYAPAPGPGTGNANSVTGACVNGVLQIVPTAFPGSDVTRTVTNNPDGSATLVVESPFKLRWQGAATALHIESTYRHADPGDLIDKVQVSTWYTAVQATTPRIVNPVNQTVISNGSFIGLIGLEDWAPWGAYGLGGLFGEPDEFLDHRCPTYTNTLPKGPSGQDNEFQDNDLYTTPPGTALDGRDHYDASGDAGVHQRSEGTIGPATQDHAGPSDCLDPDEDLQPDSVFHDGGFRANGGGVINPA